MVAHISSLDLSFLGLDLSITPNQVIGLSPATWLTPVFLIPLLSGLTALMLSLFTSRNAPSGGGGSMMMMTLMMPVMSLVFTFTVPAGVGLYWILSNLFAGVQTFVLNKFWNPKEMAEKIKAEEEERKIKEREERIEAKKKAKELAASGQEDPDVLSQKEINRRKLAEARRRNAEKYGDTYVEVTDEDLK